MGSIKLQVGMGGALVKITINRPEKFNAFDEDTLREMGGLVRGVAGSARCRVVLVTGEPPAFCSGADLQAATSSDSLSNYVGSLAKAFNNVLDTLASAPALIVTVVNGPAAGGGLALALAGDLRWALPEAKFRTGYGRVGLSIDGGLSWRLPRIVGMAQAQRILFEDPDIDADEAQALGLVHRVVALSDLQKSVEELAERMKLQSRSSIVRNRQLLLESQGRTLAQSYDAEAETIKVSAGTVDGREGVTAFVEKRAPKFTS
jgi:2-(1,2-epoxy-1,2-dihydrophenyl)acetyl-CoA isomerase